MNHVSDDGREIDDLLAQMRFDERGGRPGPKPPRLKCGLEWTDLVRRIVQAEVSSSFEDEAESAE